MNKYIILFLVTLTFASCYKPDDYTVNPQDPKDSVLVLTVSHTLDADGASIAVFTAAIPVNADPDKRTVKFTCTVGSFLDNGAKSTSVLATGPSSYLDLGSRLVATVIFKASLDTTSSVITATIGGVEKTDHVNFNAMPPQKISLVVPGFTIDSSYKNQITLTALCKRDIGLPTLNRPISFSVTDTAGTDVGYLNESIAYTDSSGSCKSIFTAGNSAYKGILIVKAQSLTSTASDTTILYLK